MNQHSKLRHWPAVSFGALTRSQPRDQNFAPVRLLPIAERELRVATRHSRTWWRRVVTLLVALVLAAFVFATVGRWASLSQVGGSIFSTLGGFGLVFALLSGPLATTDCLSRERREGTLGLLFLTDLKSYDVVFGKIVASSLDMMLILAAALPLLAMPLLVGGVTLTQFVSLVLTLANIMFLSLSVGACTSSLVASGRASLGMTLGFLIFITLVVPFVGEEVLKISSQSRTAAFAYMTCPLWAMAACLERSLNSPVWRQWLNAGGIHGLAWLCLLVACLRTRHAWRDLPGSKFVIKWRGRVDRWNKGSDDLRLAWRRFMLDRNPIQWLEGRERIQETVFGVLILTCAGFWAYRHHRDPTAWPDESACFLWPLLSHYVLCLWIAIQAPRRTADDKHSGALELLLCTPLAPAEIVRGNMAILGRRFGRMMFALLALDAYIVQAHYSQQGNWSGFRDFLKVGAYMAIVFPLQGYTMARVGLYRGLLKGNSLRATFMITWTVGLLPWVLVFGFLWTCELARVWYKGSVSFNENFIFGTWGAAHFLVFALLLARANGQLRRNFRHLAAAPFQPSWRKRWRKT